MYCAGTYLSSRAVASQVFSTLKSLTSVFGMGTGGTSLLSAPTIFQTEFTSNIFPLLSFFKLLSSTLGKALDRLVLASLTPHDAYTLSLSTS